MTNCPVVNDTALRLTGQIDELSRALARAGVPLAERARLLERAALAAMQAVLLEHAHDRVAPPPAAERPAAVVTPLTAAPSIRSAAA